MPAAEVPRRIPAAGRRRAEKEEEALRGAEIGNAAIGARFGLGSRAAIAVKMVFRTSAGGLAEIYTNKQDCTISCSPACLVTSDFAAYCSTVFIVGNRMTSRMVSELVNSITQRSMPMPIPPVGGRPYSRAVM